MGRINGRRENECRWLENICFFFSSSVYLRKRKGARCRQKNEFNLRAFEEQEAASDRERERVRGFWLSDIQSNSIATEKESRKRKKDSREAR